MEVAIQRFIAAHEIYTRLDLLRCDCGSPQEREFLYIQILQAYLSLQYHAMIITGMQAAAGMEFARSN